MRGLAYYEEEWFHEYLLSPERKEIFPPDLIMEQIPWKGIQNFLDFGMGNGFFLPYILNRLEPEAHVWGAECQELLIDQTLYNKVKDGIDNFTPFYNEKNEHPLLPEWLPSMDLILCSCVLSLFANPSLAIRGIGRSLSDYGKMVVLDWEKTEAPSGPEITQKVSSDRMMYFINDAGFKIINTLKINKYFYGFVIVYDPDSEIRDTSYQGNI